LHLYGLQHFYKRFRCLDPSTSRIYITRHAQFDENYFPSLDTSQAQSMSSFQFSNFLEPTPPYPNMPASSPTPHSLHITQSRSNSCILCTDPVNEPMQMDNSIAGSSLQHSDPGSTSLALTELAPPLPIAVSQMSSHPMLIQAKAGIFKTQHLANLAFLGSFDLLSALLAPVKPKGFKSAAKNPSWLAVMDEEV